MRIITAADRELIWIETVCSGKESIQWEWSAEESISPRARFYSLPEGYHGNPPSVLSKEKGIYFCSQPLNDGGGYTTAWKQEEEGRKNNMFITIQFDVQDNRQAIVNARKELQKVTVKRLPEMIRKHREYLMLSRTVTTPTC